MPEKRPGHQNRKEENTITNSRSIIIPGLEAPGRCALTDAVIEMGNKAFNWFYETFLPKPFASMLREMNKVSDRPGLGAEPAPVGVKLYFIAKFCVVFLVRFIKPFIALFSFSRGKRKSR